MTASALRRRSPAPAVNIRHELDPARVAQEIERQVAELKRHRLHVAEQAAAAVAAYARDEAAGQTTRMWTAKPQGPEAAVAGVDESIRLQRCHYATVRVIELPPPGKRFVLVYGNTRDSLVTSGTGPFRTFDEAAGWFFRGGR